MKMENTMMKRKKMYSLTNAQKQIFELASYSGENATSISVVLWMKDEYDECVLQNFIPSKNHHSSNESSASTHICSVPSRYNFAYSSGLSMASAFNAQSDPGVFLKSFSASQQSMRSI